MQNDFKTKFTFLTWALMWWITFKMNYIISTELGTQFTDKLRLIITKTEDSHNEYWNVCDFDVLLHYENFTTRQRNILKSILQETLNIHVKNLVFVFLN